MKKLNREENFSLKFDYRDSTSTYLSYSNVPPPGMDSHHESVQEEFDPHDALESRDDSKPGGQYPPASSSGQYPSELQGRDHQDSHPRGRRKRRRKASKRKRDACGSTVAMAKPLFMPTRISSLMLEPVSECDIASTTTSVCCDAEALDALKAIAPDQQ